MFGRGSWPEAGRIAAILRQETVGGVLLLAATVLALVWANSPWSHRYDQLRDARVGSSALHLQLTLGQWAADGLLAIFFFVAGLELKREFVAGDLRNPRRAAIPVVAAVSGVAVPALIYALINTGGGAARQGWAIPTATDIAFALAVLAVISSHLPSGLRTFLLTLAVVDDLLAITIIAVFYTASLSVVPLLLALIPLALFGLLVQRRVRSWYLLLPLAAVTWGLVHASGIHATVAGVLLAFTVPVLRSDRNGGPAAGPGMAEHFEHRMRPLSSGFAVPVFAFFSAGVTVGGFSGFADSMADRVTIGIVVALVVGKTIGIFGSTVLMARFTGAELDTELSWTDVLGIAILAGVGFTVSLLIGELAFGPGSAADDHVKVGVLVGSVVSAALAAVVLGRRNRTHRSRREAAEGGNGPVSSPDLLARATAVLAGAGVPTPEPDARALIARFGGDVVDLWPAVERRAAREPLEYLTGVARFRSLELAVGPGVFVPRRESEVAVQLAVDELRRSTSDQPVAVDLGTGCGAIALALATEVPVASVWGVEVSPAAFGWAQRNFEALAPRNARPLLADLSDALPELDAQVDVVVANPPYIPADAIPREPEVRLHSPEVALFGGPDGLDLVRAVSRTGRRLLRPGGLLVVEHGELQADDIAGLLRSDGWSDIRVSRDHLGRDRATAARSRQDVG